MRVVSPFAPIAGYSVTDSADPAYAAQVQAQQAQAHAQQMQMAQAQHAQQEQQVSPVSEYDQRPLTGKAILHEPRGTVLR